MVNCTYIVCKNRKLYSLIKLSILNFFLFQANSQSEVWKWLESEAFTVFFYNKTCQNRIYTLWVLASLIYDIAEFIFFCL